MKKSIFFLTLVLMVLGGCKKTYLDRLPESSPNSGTYFKSADELVLAINSAYNNICYNGAANMPGLMLYDGMSDIFWYRQTNDVQTVGLGLHTPSTTLFRQVWDLFYGGIGKCNNLLDNMNKAKAVTDPVLYARIEGEAQFLRAYFYSYLVSLYGDVPLIDHVLPLSESHVPRVAKATVVDFILSQLDEAAAKLPATYTGTDKGRATKGAALALKARIALYNAKYEVAATAAKAAMDLGVYSLYPNYRNLFTYAGEGSSETILAYDYKQTVRVSSIAQADQTRLGGGFSIYVPTRSLADSYECTDGLTVDKSPLYSTADIFANRDPRMRASILGDNDTWYGTGGITYNQTYHPDSTQCTRYTPTKALITNTEVTNAFSSFSGMVLKKYLDVTDVNLNTQSELAFMIIRYAEVLLTYAEAKIEAGQIDASVLNAINLVRARGYGVAVGATTLYPAITTTDQAELRKIIRRERKVELAGEGLRLFDIRRWKIAEKAMNGLLFGKALKSAIYHNLPKPASIDENMIPDYSSFNSLLSVTGNFKIMETREFKPATHYLWPIPQADIDVNHNAGFKQNPGY